MKRRDLALLGVFLCVLSLVAGCATNPDGTYETKRTGLGALGGAALGAAMGAIFGEGKGAAIGAGSGAVLGAAIGGYMDHQAATLEKKMPEAKVERQGDKIYVTLPSGILFEKGKDALTPEAMESLAKAAACLKESKTDIIVQGHTDPTGGDALNLPLSQRRADRVRDYLVARGVPSACLVAIGYGSSRPEFPNDTETNRSLNRRVKLEISPNSQLRQEISSTPAM